MVDEIRMAEKALGKATFEFSEKIIKSRTFARSLFAVEDISAGEVFTANNIKSIRPAYGLPPKFLNQILGKKAKVYIKKGTPLTWELIE